MKNSFIKIPLDKNNEFRTLINISIPNIKIYNLEGVEVKIDTGCPYTSIPVAKLGKSKFERMQLKKLDCANPCIKKEISFGVNDSVEKRQNDRNLLENKEFMKLESITFKHSDVVMSINGIRLDIPSVKLSYDRTGNILIGMDILKDWDIHIGTAEKSKEKILLACPNNQLNDDYYKELNKLFKV